MNNIDFRKISSAKIQEKRDLVISECSKGGYTIAQRVLVKEGNSTTTVYMKNAIHVDGIEGIENLRNALNVVLSEKNTENS